MATIIDSLVVLLRLDPKGFDQGRKQTDEGLKKTRESVDGAGKDFDKFSKRSAEGIGKLRNAAIGLFLAFQGASSVKGFISNLITGDAATGRLAANLGIAAGTLSAWQLAVKSVGGDAKDADSALTAMARAFQSYQLTGSTGNDADFKGLGVTLDDLKDPAGALLKIAEAGERMDKTEFFARLQRIGLPDSVINTLEKGRAGVEALIAAKEKDAKLTYDDVRAAQALQDKLAELETKIIGGMRPALYQLVSGLLDFANATGAINLAVPVLIGLVGAAAVAAVIAAGPYVALAAAIAAVVVAITNWQKLKGFSREELENKAQLVRNRVWDAVKRGDLAGAAAEIGGAINDPVNAGNPAGSPRIPSGGAAGGGTWVDKLQAGVDNYIAGGGQNAYGGTWADKLQAGVDSYIAGGGQNAYVGSRLKAAGYTDEQVRGIVAGINAEGGTPGARNPTSGAFGIGQWLGPRKKALFAKYGPAPNLQQQTDFLISELKGGDRGGPSVGRQSTADGALLSYIRDFMRPAKGAETYGDISRGRAYLAGRRAPAGGGGNRSSTATTTVGTINVYTAATDAEGIAKALPSAIQRRGLTNQANTGLQ